MISEFKLNNDIRCEVRTGHRGHCIIFYREETRIGSFVCFSNGDPTGFCDERQPLDYIEHLTLMEAIGRLLAG